MEQHGRVCAWDNLKCILIFMVVIGHFANQFTSESMAMRSISIIIYTFHMPLFIFLSGLLERKWDEGKPFRWDRPLFYVTVGYLLKFCIYIVKILCGQKAEFLFFSDTGSPWYMFAMAAFMVLAYLLRNQNPRIVFPLLILAACLAGYVPFIGSFLYLSRIIVFFPFYYAGFLMKPEKIAALLESRRLKWASMLTIVLLIFVGVIWIKELYPYIRLLTGRNAYMFINVKGCGMAHRLANYIISFVIGTAVLCLTPVKKIPLAGRIGQRTLQIYFWHRLILYVIMYSGFADSIRASFPETWVTVYLLIAVILTLALAPHCFGRPLQKIRKYEQGLAQNI